MTSSRSAILNAVRQKAVPPTQLPDLKQNWIQFDDLAAQFAGVLEGVGGKCFRVKSVSEINSHLEELTQFKTALVRCSNIDGAGNPNVAASAYDDPHLLENVDFALLRGELAVAENGAVWITDQRLKHRVLFFLCQHLALVVPMRDLVPHMHAAYERMTVGQRQFGAFISGPSKTADIEQSLVIGAHGPRSHIVFLVDEWE